MALMDQDSVDRPHVGAADRPVVSLYEEPEEPAGEIDWPALQFRDVFKIYRSGTAETVALRGLDLQVERGEVVAVLGPSGCGKSTLLHLAAGLDEPSAGEVRAFGTTLSRLAERELAAYRACRVAVVFQSDNLWTRLTAEENVAVALRLAGVARPRQLAAEALASFGLAERRHHAAAALSGGEQQRVAIAAAAARRASLVLADEPTGELDVVNEGIVLEAFLALREQTGASVVVVTHSERVAGAVDRVVELRDGRVAR
jgi:putative ABC transport system ATP-binding protein